MANCPLGGRCNIEQNVIYTCKVTRLDDNTFQTYTGLTDNTFKKRLYGHNSDFRKRKHRNKTMLSKYIWFLKDNNVQYELNWSILGKAKSFNPVTGVCRLCLIREILYSVQSKRCYIEFQRWGFQLMQTQMETHSFKSMRVILQLSFFLRSACIWQHFVLVLLTNYESPATNVKSCNWWLH